MEQVTHRYTFGKAEKLCNKKLIDKLFSEGRSFYQRPIKVLFLNTELTTGFPVKVLITVPKKYIREATDRNRIKRLLREAYRKHKHILNGYLISLGEGRIVAFIYTGREMAEYGIIEALMIKSLERIVNMGKEQETLNTSSPESLIK